ncbi:PREDICTED: angiotensin-converting enzyme-like, partial [Priapulus caudatus]|uniref:Angiotensin-converting enzyme n=1 Tax=Priapulus caudatus TaxID=37621 RepID=A0ABM1EVX1_PRICU
MASDAQTALKLAALHITDVLAKSRNYNELLHYWQAWHDNVGPPMRNDYIDFVALSNKASVENGFSDTGDYWRSAYESDTFREDIAALMEQVKPMYDQLHAYVRHKLGLWYGTDKVAIKGPIPAHLLGDMWSQSWENIYDMLEPYPGAQAVDVTDAMVEQNYDAQRIFEVSESFFTSLGMSPMPQEFWNMSMIVKPEDRDVVCYASAWDFYDGKDFRIKQCTDITMSWLSTTHHEMGHVEYFLEYKDQPVKFRDGANPGFHEAIGDTISLSVLTPAHLQKIGLLDDVVENHGKRTSEAYFVSYIVQFQFHKALCDAAVHEGALDKCDIYENTDAGDKLMAALQLGSSKPWPEAMTMLTGQDKMDASALIEYFKPLTDWLKLYNSENDVPVGWWCDDDGEAQSWLDNYNVEAEVVRYSAVVASWNYNTNITDENAQAEIVAALESAEFDKRKSKELDSFNGLKITDEQINREIKKIKDIGISALPDAEVEEWNTIVSDMTTIYSTGKVCKYGKTCTDGSNDNMLPLDPDITRIMATSRDYDELLHYWRGWHDTVGSPMKQEYIEYVKLSNKAAIMNSKLKPLYEKLHAFTRFKLSKQYIGEVNLEGPIAAHLL